MFSSYVRQVQDFICHPLFMLVFRIIFQRLCCILMACFMVSHFVSTSWLQLFLFCYVVCLPFLILQYLTSIPMALLIFDYVNLFFNLNTIIDKRRLWSVCTLAHGYVFLADFTFDTSWILYLLRCINLISNNSVIFISYIILNNFVTEIMCLLL